MLREQGTKGPRERRRGIGGAVQQICDCSSDSGAVNQDGVILLGGSPDNPAITRISTAGETTTLHKAARTEALPSSPAFLPDGRRFLFAEGGGIFLTSMDQPQADVRQVGDGPDRFALVQGSSGSFFLLRQSNGGMDVPPFDMQKGEIAGPPLALPLAGEQTTPSVSNTGILLRLMQVETRQVAVWLDRQGKRLGEAGTTEGYSGIDLSPDGGRSQQLGSSSTSLKTRFGSSLSRLGSSPVFRVRMREPIDGRRFSWRLALDRECEEKGCSFARL